MSGTSIIAQISMSLKMTSCTSLDSLSQKRQKPCNVIVFIIIRPIFCEILIGPWQIRVRFYTSIKKKTHVYEYLISALIATINII